MHTYITEAYTETYTQIQRHTHTHTYTLSFHLPTPFSSDFFIPNFPPKSLHSFLPLPLFFNPTVNSNMQTSLQASGSRPQGDQMSQFA